eukprot:gene5310-5979_t
MRSRSRSPVRRDRERRYSRSRSHSRERYDRRADKFKDRDRKRDDRRRGRSRSPVKQSRSPPRRSRSRSPRRRDRDRDRGDRDRDRGERDKDRRDRNSDRFEKREEVSSDKKVSDDMSASFDEEMMQKVMGFGGFDSTKGKHVEGQMEGVTTKVARPKKYRQYMNRRGGFNRPLDHVN